MIVEDVKNVEINQATGSNLIINIRPSRAIDM